MNVQVCNMRSIDFDIKFRNSLMETGFAVVTNHGIDWKTIVTTQMTWRDFFIKPSVVKDVYVDIKDSNLGYTRFGGEKALGGEKADLKEFYHWKPAYSSRLPLSVEQCTAKIFFQLSDIGEQLLHILDKADGTNYREACSSSDNTIFRALYYPALNDIKVEPGAIRAAAHEDINFITLLVAASDAGLQVQDTKGNWIDVPHEENSIVVNIGDMLQLTSKGKYRSTTHRVVNPSIATRDRLSIPLFIHPHGDTLLAPGVTAKQFLTERLNAIYQTGYKK